MRTLLVEIKRSVLGWWVLTAIFLLLLFHALVSGNPALPEAAAGHRPPRQLTQPSPLPLGLSEKRLRLPSTTISLYIYKPANYLTLRGPLILVFHGFGRHAREYRDAI